MAFNWNDIRYFIAVVETGSLSAAARELNVSQPTVGRRIREFEDCTGARLFERLDQGYVLTTAGEEILHMAHEIARQADEIKRRVGGEARQLHGRVRLTTTEGLGSRWLAKRLPRFHALYPQIRLELMIGEVLLDLPRREADIALRIGTPGSQALVGRRLGCIACGLYASGSYLEDRGEPSSLDELADHDVIESVGELADVKQVRRLREIAPTVSVSMRSNSMLTQIAALRAGLGILPLPQFAIEDESDLHRILASEFDPQLELWLLTRRDLKQAGKIRATLDFLIEEVNREPWLSICEDGAMASN